MHITSLVNSSFMKNLPGKSPLHLLAYAFFIILFVLSLLTDGNTSIALSYTNASLVFVYLLYINRKRLVSVFGKFDRYTYLCILLIIFLASFVILSYNVKFAVVDDWEQITCAKSMITGDKDMWSQCFYGYTYPYFLFLSFLVFGTSPASASILSNLMYIIGGLSIFLSALVLFKNKKPALLSSLAFLLFYHIVTHTTVLRGRAQIVTCFLAFVLLIFLLTFKTKSNSMILASFIAIFFAAGIKYETLNLIYPLLIGVYFFMDHDRKKIGIIALSAIVSFLLFFNSFGHISQFFVEHSGDWAVMEMSNRDPFPSSDVLDKFVNPVLGPNFSVTYLKKNLSSFFQYWTSEMYIFITLISIVGIFAYFRKDKKKAIFPLLCFLFLTLIYMLYYIPYYSRFAMLAVPFLVVFFGFGLFSIINILPRYKNHAFVILLILIPIFLISSFHADVLRERGGSYLTEQDYEIGINIREYCQSNSTVIVPHDQTKAMLMFMLDDYRIFSFGDFFDDDDYRMFISGVTDIDKYNITIPKSDKTCLVYNYRCGYGLYHEFGYFRLICDKILKDYKADYIFNSTHYKIVKLN